MLCQNCFKEEAVVKFTQIINNEKKEINLCKKCAELKGLHNPLVNISKLFEGLLMEMVGNELPAPTSTEEEKLTRCPQCNMTMRDFRKRGLLGCDKCYQTFYEELNVLLRRIHGSNKHIGNRPSRISSPREDYDLPKLQKELNLAIQREEYERAAQLRDLIQELKRKSLNNLKRS